MKVIPSPISWIDAVRFGLCCAVMFTPFAQITLADNNGVSKSIPVIYDSDIGDDIDDMWAFVLLLKCPELDVKLVVGDYGRPKYRSTLFAKLLKIAGRTNIPIGVGLDIDRPGPGRQQDWIADYDLQSYPGTVYDDGVQAIIDTIMKSPEPITVIAVGPLANIRAALEREPRIAEKARFVGMHGSVRKGYRGSLEIAREHNVREDVAACQAALSAPWNVTITPVDTCGLVSLRGTKYSTVRDFDDPLIRALMENYRLWWKNHPNHKDNPLQPESASSTLFDTVAVYLAFTQELCKMESLRIRVTDEGKTIIDGSAKTMQVATQWIDLGKFEDFLVARLTHTPRTTASK